MRIDAFCSDVVVIGGPGTSSDMSESVNIL
jgi:hypothetical protein